MLGDYFGRRMAAELSWEQWPGFADHVAEAMENHTWPGNVRELRNVVERAVYRWDNWEQPIGECVFDPFESPWKPLSMSSAPVSNGVQKPGEAAPAASEKPRFDNVDDLRAAVDAHERSILEHALGANRWNQRQTAKSLGLSYDQLRHAIKKHGLADSD